MPDSGFAPRLSCSEVTAVLGAAFPAAVRPTFGELTEVGPGHARMVLDPGPEALRPGGIVSGPTLMAMADVAAYAVILAHIGPVTMAVTHTLTISFLRACRHAPVTADARLLKLGRRMATVDVRFWQGDSGHVVAQATTGYAIPDPMPVSNR